MAIGLWSNATVQAEHGWQPKTTWVFAVGVLEWQAPETWPNMPNAKLNRREVEWQGKWYRAQAVDAAENRFKVHNVKYPDTWDEWIGPDRMRPFQPNHVGLDAQFEVKWPRAQKWYPSKIRRTWYGLYFVHYDDDPDEWDEWVSPDAIRLKQ